MEDAINHVERANYELGRSEAILDAMSLVRDHIDLLHNKVSARWEELKELRKQGENIWGEDDQLMKDLNAKLRILHAIHSKLVKL